MEKSNLDVDVPRYLMTVTPDVCGLLGAVTLQCFSAEVSDNGCHIASLKFAQDPLEVYEQSFIWDILVFNQEQLVCVTFSMLLFSRLTVHYYNLCQLFHT